MKNLTVRIKEDTLKAIKVLSATSGKPLQEVINTILSRNEDVVKISSSLKQMECDK